MRKTGSVPPSGTEHISPLLKTLIGERHFAAKMLEQQVLSLWREVVGEPIANHAHPASLSDGILTVWTTHPAYQTEVSFHKVQIVAGLNARLERPVLRDLRLECRPGGRGSRAPDGGQEEQGLSSAKGVRTSTASVSPAVSPATRTAMELALAGITDEALKNALQRLFVTQSECFVLAQSVR